LLLLLLWCNCVCLECVALCSSVVVVKEVKKS
jgi:hypothetical protein